MNMTVVLIGHTIRYFVKLGFLDKALSKIAHNAFDSRQVSDYQDFQTPTAEQAKAQYDDATQFITEIKQKRHEIFEEKIVLPPIS